MKNRVILLSLFALGVIPVLSAQEASIREEIKEIKSYPYSDPNPVAAPDNLYYPYFRFDGFTSKGENRKWKNVVLENDYIKVRLFPEVGGKIWGAIDKTTGKEFIYDNGVAKFRDIAMRGPWTSGGIEFNFGIIGHAPTTSNPVDYLLKEKEDGSVSCYIFSYEWITRTVWNVEVNLPKDKAYFTTHTSWYNQSSIDQPYYHWMNAGYPVGNNAEFCYPGDRQISHGGQAFTFPEDEQGHKIGWYEGNKFGRDKSYHVLGYYNDYYGIYWHGDDFGSVHYANFDEKLGMKIFLWGLSRSGSIWEDLLTDEDGQYIELQSGKVFNQPASSSAWTPYKHRAFAPQLTDQWTEYWYPVKGIQGISKASTIGALHVTRNNGQLQLAFSPLSKLSTNLKIYKEDKLIKTLPLKTEVLEPLKLTVTGSDFVPEGKLKVVIGNDLLTYSEIAEDFDLNRPTAIDKDFDWNSTYGLYTQGEQWMNQKQWNLAETFLLKALKKEPTFAPALVRLASLYFREGRYDESVKLTQKALSLNTYDAEANYIHGLVHRTLHKTTEAKAAFSIASFSAKFRTAAYEQLGELYAAERNWKKAEHYALKSLEANAMNLEAHQLLMMVYRKLGQKEKAQKEIDLVLKELPLYHPVRFEQACLQSARTVEELNDFKALIRNELPAETYLEMAGWYERTGAIDEALLLLDCAGDHPLAFYQKAFLLAQKGDQERSSQCIKKANALSPELIFPFRHETMQYLNWAAQQKPHWKIDYYRALLYWVNQQRDKAKALLNQQEPDGYAPFYLTRAKMKSGDDRLKDLLKAEEIETSWRTGFALINHYNSQRNWEQVVNLGKKYGKLYPDNYYIGLKYANGLCESGKFKDCIRLLDKMTVLPNEGAYAGRAVYRSANLFQAIDYIKARKYNAALKYVHASKEWPENLGVGKPFEEDIDQRLEDFIEGEIYQQKGDKQQAKACFEKVIARHSSTAHFESAQLLVALALRNMERKEEADKIIQVWSKNHKNNQPAMWCKAIYEGDNDKATRLIGSRKNADESTPWEYTYNDRNFNLIIRLMENL